MKERLKELAKNGKTFSVRDIIAMKNDLINGKMQVSDNVAERLKRPVPMAQPPVSSRSTGPSSSSSSIHPHMMRDKLPRGNWQPHRSAGYPTTLAPQTLPPTHTPIKLPWERQDSFKNSHALSNNQINSMVGSYGMNNGGVTAKPIHKLPPKTSPNPGIKRVVVPSKYARLPPGGQPKYPHRASFMKELQSISTTKAPRTIRTRVVAYSTPVYRVTTPTSNPSLYYTRATTTKRPETKPVAPPTGKMAFLQRFQAQRGVATTQSPLTTTAPRPVPVNNAKETFLQRMKNGLSQGIPPNPGTLGGKSPQATGMGSAGNKQPFDAREAFFAKLKEQMRARMGQNIDPDFDSKFEKKREFFIKLMKQKQAAKATNQVLPSALPKPKMQPPSTNLRESLAAKLAAKKKEEQLISKPIDDQNARNSLMQQLAERKALEMRQNNPKSIFSGPTRPSPSRNLPLNGQNLPSQVASRADFMSRFNKSPMASPSPPATPPTQTTINPKMAFLMRLKQKQSQVNKPQPRPQKEPIAPRPEIFPIGPKDNVLALSKSAVAADMHDDMQESGSDTTSGPISGPTSGPNSGAISNPNPNSISTSKLDFMKRFGAKQNAATTQSPITTTTAAQTTVMTSSNDARNAFLSKLKSKTSGSLLVKTDSPPIPTFPPFKPLVPSSDSDDDVIKSILCK